MSVSKKAWKNDEANIIDDLLKSAHQVPKIEAYLKEEINYIKNNIAPNSSVIDFGCGNGRHLKILEPQISKGLGIDMNRSYLEEASSSCTSDKIRFEVGDIENYQSTELFDVAISMYNTFGNVENQKGMIESMLNSIRQGGKVIISTFSPESISARLEFYKVMGFEKLDIEKCTDIGWVVVLEKK